MFDYNQTGVLMDFDLIIVGAGVAAAAALDALNGRHLRIAVIDKAQSAGGRCATRRIAEAENAPWLDSGAQYFTARSPALQGKVLSWEKQNWLRPWSPRIVRLDSHSRLQPSPDQQTRWVSPNGLNRLVRQVMAGHNSNTVQLVTGTRLTRARYTQGQWQLNDHQGASWQARHLLLSTPPEQARALLDQSHAALVPDIDMHACLAVLLGCETAIPFDALFGSHESGAISWAANNLSKLKLNPANGLWSVHANPQFSAALTDPVEAAEHIRETFAALCQLSPDQFQPLHHHLWRYARPVQSHAHPTPAQLLACNLALAGDWMHGGRIEGAWLSGLAAVQALYG